jgi:hypothetical protein
MNSFWALGILAATFTPVILSLSYFKKQKEICRRYPFFGLRDKIILEIITKGENDKLRDSYKKINFVAERLKELNFGLIFFMSAISEFLGELLDQKYEEALRGESIKNCPLELSPFDKELALLVIEAAKKNSFLLRFAMTKTGFKILFFPLVVSKIYRFLRKHPTFLRHRRTQLKTIQKYSILAQCRLAEN